MSRFEKNLSLKDRIFRVILGVSLGLGGIAYGSLWGLVGLYPAATALVGWSPMYSLFGVSSCRFIGSEAVCDGE